MDDTFHPGSLHPPTYGDADRADSTRPVWILLDFHAYFADRRNATTAACKTRNCKEIQVTFFPRPPARTSRLLEDIFGGLEAQIRPRSNLAQPSATRGSIGSDVVKP
ncbi:hypothetical protein GQ55_5G508300 [Panicum hallii var. hallii]|uniref:Uncharacterized protein n=1 Tax=Panicum hallii var. hallii TaxID=1504633 RepID=A0A2T7DS64_9POAL|nr:hypothetical protein GQ55_5G508300 [Panicum hallii var. hallii]PUZ58423.1 hypothetical protein GQ55_5G508300 [Panicum hallii var. hallii]